MQANVTVRYFAVLRELSGTTSETVQITHGDTASRLFMRLAEKYAFPLGLSDIRVAINDDFASGDHPLTEGDQVVFIPPVSGG